MNKHNSTNGALLKASLWVSAIAMGAGSFSGTQVLAQQTFTLPTGAVNVSMPSIASNFGTTGSIMTKSGVVQVNQGYTPVTLQTQPTSVQTSAYTGPVFSLPSTNAGQQLPAETLNGRIVTSINTPLPPAQPIIKSVVTSPEPKPIVAPVITPVVSPVIEPPKMTDYLADGASPYFVIKGMGQDEKTFTWNAGGTGNIGHLVTDTTKGRTLLVAAGTPLNFNLPLKNLLAEAELGYRTAEVKSMVGNFGTVTNPTGEIRTLSGALNLIKEFETTGRLGGYVGAGLGVAEIEHKDFSGTDPTATVSSIAMSRDDDMAFMANMFAGLEYALNNKASIVAEVRQVNFSDIDRNADNGSELEDSYILREGGLGLKIGF